MRIGIRHEDKSVWEARAPVIPWHVGHLIDEYGLQFSVQPSDQRVFSAEEYAECGASISEKLADCDVVLGVKEIPADCFERGKTYVFFSHTIKGQPRNMPMLWRMMELGCNLIDYERIVDDGGRRVVFFGEYAGLAGMIDTLWSLGQRLKVEGRTTPLADLMPAHSYESLAAAKEHLAEVATRIASTDALVGCGPFVFGFAGYGHVSQGAQEIFRILAPVDVSPGELGGLDRCRGDGHFFRVVFKEEHMVEPIAPGALFELQEYYEKPERYRSVFERYLPHLTVLVNCIYWDPKYPRLVTIDSLKRLRKAGSLGSLKVIGDISCDVGGSIECNVRATDPGNPVYVYDVDEDAAIDGFRGNGPVILAVEILPTELPRESSVAFSEALLGLLPGLARSDPSGTFDDWDLPAPLKRAVILHKGELTAPYQYMRRFLEGGA